MRKLRSAAIRCCSGEGGGERGEDDGGDRNESIDSSSTESRLTGLE